MDRRGIHTTGSHDSLLVWPRRAGKEGAVYKQHTAGDAQIQKGGLRVNERLSEKGMAGGRCKMRRSALRRVRVVDAGEGSSNGAGRKGVLDGNDRSVEAGDEQKEARDQHEHGNRVLNPVKGSGPALLALPRSKETRVSRGSSKVGNKGFRTHTMVILEDPHQPAQDEAEEGGEDGSDQPNKLRGGQTISQNDHWDNDYCGSKKGVPGRRKG